MTQKERRKKADELVRNRMYWSAMGGLLPLPVLDLGSVTMIQLDMMRELSDLYDIPYHDKQIRSRVVVAISGAIPRFLASGIKVIPFFGTLVGEALVPVLSGATTLALGQALIKHFEEGGDLDDFNFDSIKGFYNQLASVGERFLSSSKKKRK